jgi:hypothetical protein
MDGVDPMKLSFELPLRVASKANERTHWAIKARDAKRERMAARAKFPHGEARALLVVTLTRLGPRALDSDNLAGSMKNIRDGIADALRIDDASPLVRWEYEQERGEYAVRVKVEAA